MIARGEPPPPITWGGRLRAARRHRELTLVDLADATGLRVVRVSDLERGSVPTVAEQQAIGRVLGEIAPDSDPLDRDPGGPPGGGDCGGGR